MLTPSVFQLLLRTTFLQIGLALSMELACLAQVFQEGVVAQLDPPLVAKSFSDRGDRVLWEGRIPYSDDSIYMRIHFTSITASTGTDYTVVVRGTDERELARYTSKQFSRDSSFFTEVLFNQGAIIQVEQTKNGRPVVGLSFRIESIIREINPRGRFAPQSTVPDWQYFDSLSLGKERPYFPLLVQSLRQASGAVAKIFTGDGAVCTGFLISQSDLLTSYHCIEHSTKFQETRDQSEPLCSDVRVYFDFYGVLQQGEGTQTQCLKVKKRSEKEKLDYAVIEVPSKEIENKRLSKYSKFLRAGVTDSPKREFLTLSSRPIEAMEEVFVVHHPGGLQEAVSFCRLYAGQSAYPEHDCSTIGGSSGAPIIDSKGEVVALHSKGGYDDKMTVREINLLLTQGKVFRNGAISLQKILEDQKRTAP